MITSKLQKNIFPQLILIIMLFLINAPGCTQKQGVLSLENQFWNPDSSHSFKYKEYSLGVAGGGYQTIEHKGEELLRFEFAVVYGGWLDNETIKIVSSDLPKKSNIDKTELKVIVEKADDYDDYKRDSYLIHLGR